MFRTSAKIPGEFRVIRKRRVRRMAKETRRDETTRSRHLVTQQIGFQAAPIRCMGKRQSHMKVQLMWRKVAEAKIERRHGRSGHADKPATSNRVDGCGRWVYRGRDVDFP